MIIIITSFLVFRLTKVALDIYETQTTRAIQHTRLTAGFLFPTHALYSWQVIKWRLQVARPTDYSDEVIEKARSYLENFEELGDVVPTIAGMACEIGVSRETLYAWSKDESKPEFSDIFIQVSEYQERKLVNGGLAGGFNPAVTKMMLTKHGYSDRQEIDHRSADGSMSPTRIELVAPNDHSED